MVLFQVYNSEQRWELCKQKDFFRLPCQETEQTLYLSFENEDNNIRVGFAIYFEGTLSNVHFTK